VSWDEEIAEIERRKELARAQGGAEAVARQHEKGRLSIRERIEGLVDPGSFDEMGPAAGAPERDAQGRLTGFSPANFVLGIGAVGGRPVAVGGEDFTLRGGSPNAAGLRKSVYAEELALQYRIPLVRLHEGGGGSVTGAQGKGSTAPSTDPVFAVPRFQSVARVLGTVPVAAAALGPVAGLPASRLVASHFSVMVRGTAQVMTAGPAVVGRALGQAVDKEALGGAALHERSGVVDNLAGSEAEALEQIRRFLGYLPPNVWELPPAMDGGDDPERREPFLAEAVPRSRRRAFDMRRIAAAIVDTDSLFEMGRGYGPGQITALARLDGRPVGLFANDCRYYAGAMTAQGAQKVRRFIEFCETFHLPIVALVDEPGFMIGVEAEAAGTIRHGTAAVLAAATCRVPWASVIVRKVYGVAGAAHFGPGAFVLSWPSAETGALPLEGGIAVAFGREIAAAPDPEARRQELEEAFAERLSPFPRAEQFAVHDLIDPRETRPRLCRWVRLVEPQQRSLLGPVTFAYRP